MTSLQHGEGPRFESEWVYFACRVCGEVAERSKALRQGRNLFGGAGSNPAPIKFYPGEGKEEKSIAAGLEPATVGSEVQRSSIEPRDHV